MTPEKTLTITGKIGNRVYQRVRAGLGNVPGDPTRSLQNRAYVIPTPCATPAQLARRARFATAVAAWHTLAPEEKAAYNTRAARSGRAGFNLYISEAQRWG